MTPKKRSPVLRDLLFQKKPYGVILALHEAKHKYPTKVAKEIDCTYTHTLKILSVLKDEGIVEFKKHGRIKEVHLTDKGAKLAKALADIDNSFL